jgi:hypothetical protein
MKRIVFIFALVLGIYCNAQMNMIFNQVKINNVVSYFSEDMPAVHYDPNVEISCDIVNYGNSIILTPNTADYYLSFKLDNKDYQIYLSILISNMFLIDTITLNTNDTLKIEIGGESFLSGLERPKNAKLTPIYFEDRIDYSNVIYNILPTLRFIYKQNDLELVSDTPKRIILNK